MLYYVFHRRLFINDEICVCKAVFFLLLLLVVFVRVVAFASLVDVVQCLFRFEALSDLAFIANGEWLGDRSN